MNLQQILSRSYRYPRSTLYTIMYKLRVYNRCRWIMKREKDASVSPNPFIYTFKLTMKCNLRCKMCMQWGDKGSHYFLSQEEQEQELEWNTLQRVILQIYNKKPFCLFWGGEPLLYSKFSDLLALLKNKRVFSSFCTNGLLLSDYKNLLLNNPYANIIISLDGFERENDYLRGRGIFKKVVKQIEILNSYGKKKPFIAIEFTVLPENLGIMYDFCNFAKTLNIDWLIFNLKWFISSEQATMYRHFMLENFGIKEVNINGYMTEYKLDKEKFICQFRKIREKRWPMQVSWHPFFKNPALIYRYVDNPIECVSGYFCHKQWMRVDIMPNGDVVTCKAFPDYVVGNIRDNTINEIWNNESYRTFRKVITKSLLPVCSKCEALGKFSKK